MMSLAVPEFVITAGGGGGIGVKDSAEATALKVAALLAADVLKKAADKLTSAVNITIIATMASGRRRCGVTFIHNLFSFWF